MTDKKDYKPISDVAAVKARLARLEKGLILFEEILTTTIKELQDLKICFSIAVKSIRDLKDE